jgi:hypothetical protein
MSRGILISKTFLRCHCSYCYDPIFFFFFLFMSLGCDYVSELQPSSGLLFTRARWYTRVQSHSGMKWQGRTEELVEKHAPVPLCQSQIPHGLTRARIRASVVRGRRLTDSAMTTVNPLKSNGNYIVISSQVLFHDGSLLLSKVQYTTVDYN